MKTILLFPGIDAIESDQIRKQCLQLPEVRLRLGEAQEILDKLNVPLSLLKTLEEPRQENLQWFSGMILGAMAVQVGVFDRYKNQGKPIDALLGMSLGDVARSVCAGVTSFSAAYLGLLQFLQKIPGVLGTGSTFQVRYKETPACIKTPLRLKDFDLEVSVYQSSHSLLVTGPIENLQAWAKFMAAEKDEIQIRALFDIPVPLHSKLLRKTAFSMAPYIYKHAHFEQIRFPVYSTIFNDWITNSEMLKKDMLKNIYSPVCFSQSIHQLIGQEGKIRFVNIGPASTMLAFIKQTNVARDQYELVNFFNEEVSCLVG